MTSGAMELSTTRGQAHPKRPTRDQIAHEDIPRAIRVSADEVGRPRREDDESPVRREPGGAERGMLTLPVASRFGRRRPPVTKPRTRPDDLSVPSFVDVHVAIPS